ncbi:MAG: dienelactone hydrolase family protein [Myxococcales bacterium]|nr:dienelactone hydrolase family protein [Myxococcales bacterium]
MKRLRLAVAAAALAWACGGTLAESSEREPAPARPAASDASVTWLPPPKASTKDAGTALPEGPFARDAGQPAPAAIDPGAAGPYLAGVRTVTLTDASRSRKLAVDVWYPVDRGNTDGKANEYRLDGLFGPIASIKSSARRDATAASLGARGLVLFSHGYGGIRFQSYFLTEHLASHGYAVAAPDHPGNTLADFGQLGSDAAAAQSAVDRPLDMLFVLGHMLAGSAGVAVSVDPARIAATGHSFGGWTALEVARRDARIKVAFPMAPGFKKGASPSFVATLARPLLFFGGSKDSTTPFETDQRAPYELAQPPKALVKVLGAGHLDFSNLCEVPAASLLVDDGCDPQSIDPKEVHARARTLSVAFLGRYLDGAQSYEPYLEPTYAAGLGKLEYWRAP